LYFEINWAGYYGFASKSITVKNDNHSRGRISNARATNNKKEKLNGREIRTTVFIYWSHNLYIVEKIYCSICETLFGIDKNN
jgi:predicted nucleic acid-binding Zn finger protein